ncbi:unnamed protein product [Aphanomyces euteiches]
MDNLEIALDSRVDNLFFMGGSVTDLIQAVRLAKERNKGTFVHLDLIRGLSSTDKESIDFIRDFIGADGIITPKSHLVKEAKRAGLFAILHLFVLDSLALSNGLKMVKAVQPDAVELMPGLIPKVVSLLSEAFADIPIIASGLIQTKDEVVQILNAGATSLSVSEKSLWSFTFQDLVE